MDVQEFGASSVAYYDADTANTHDIHECNPVFEEAMRTIVPLFTALSLDAVDENNKHNSVENERNELSNKSNEE